MSRASSRRGPPRASPGGCSGSTPSHDEARHTILDRPLYRAGETVHIKHVVRRRVLAGFALPPAPWPDTVEIRRDGGDQTYKIPVSFDAAGLADGEWTIPPDAKLGHYSVRLTQSRPAHERGVSGRQRHRWDGERLSGSFRVEEFRLPLMKAAIVPPAGTLIRPETVPLDLNVSYFSGGPAGGLPVRLRAQLRPGAGIPGEAFEDFVFAAGPAPEGVERGERAAPPPVWSSSLALDL